MPCKLVFPREGNGKAFALRPFKITVVLLPIITYTQPLHPHTYMTLDLQSPLRIEPYQNEEPHRKRS